MGSAADDFQLLDRYARTSDQAAFAELTRRYVNIVYSAAVRRVGNRHLAEDVTQAVFLILATKPHAVRTSLPLSGWLLTTVRYAAANAIKIEQRRRKHEAAAAAAAAAAGTSGACSANPSDVLVWQEVAGELDDAVLQLPALDRRAILLRYFEQRPIREIAQDLNVTEAAAKQRLNRSVEKLRRRLNRRGAIFAPAGAAGLAALLSTHAVGAAPAGLLSTAGSAALAGSAAAAGGSTALTIAKGAIAMMTLTKLKAAALLVVAAVIVGSGTAITLDRARADSATTASAPPGAAVRAKAAARVAAAEEVLDVLERASTVEPITPTFLDLKATAQRRLAEARIDAAADRAARVRAAEQYVRQSSDMLALLERRVNQDVTAVGIAQGKYHLASAEYLLATLQAAR